MRLVVTKKFGRCRWMPPTPHAGCMELGAGRFRLVLPNRHVRVTAYKKSSFGSSLPCRERAAPASKTSLEELSKQSPGSTTSVAQLANRIYQTKNEECTAVQDISASSHIPDLLNLHTTIERSSTLPRHTPPQREEKAPSSKTTIVRPQKEV